MAVVLGLAIIAIAFGLVWQQRGRDRVIRTQVMRMLEEDGPWLVHGVEPLGATRVVLFHPKSGQLVTVILSEGDPQLRRIVGYFGEMVYIAPRTPDVPFQEGVDPQAELGAMIRLSLTRPDD
jgi:hypothetical protein